MTVTITDTTNCDTDRRVILSADHALVRTYSSPRRNLGAGGHARRLSTHTLLRPKSCLSPLLPSSSFLLPPSL